MSQVKTAAEILADIAASGPEAPDEDLESTTAAGVARMLGVTNVTVRQLANSGDLPYFRSYTGHRRFLIADVRKYQLLNAATAAEASPARAVAVAAASTGTD